MLITMLEGVGVTPQQERVYQVLLQEAATVRDLVESTGLARGAVIAAIRQLLAMGLVVRLTTRPTRYRAAQPDVAVEALIHEREREHDRARTAAAQLMGDFHAGVLAAGPPATVELLDDVPTARQRYVQLQLAARTEVRMIDAPPYMVVIDEPNPFELAALSRGVRYRVIYDVAALDNPRKREVLRVCAAAGEQARVLAGVPAKLHIADGSLAMITKRGGAAVDGAVVVHPSSLLDLLVRLFDLLWEQATDLTGAPAATALTPVQTEILALLAAGEKDAAIARVLGLHVRTVRRHIEHICARLNAPSRFVAGMRAAEQGWI
jgi:DNA-binding NarL/FixJ family response regulator